MKKKPLAIFISVLLIMSSLLIFLRFMYPSLLRIDDALMMAIVATSSTFTGLITMAYFQQALANVISRVDLAFLAASFYGFTLWGFVSYFPLLFYIGLLSLLSFSALIAYIALKRSRNPSLLKPESSNFRRMLFIINMLMALFLGSHFKGVYGLISALIVFLPLNYFIGRTGIRVPYNCHKCPLRRFCQSP